MEKIIKKQDFIKKNKNMVFKQGSKQILLIGIEDKIFALDNRCPHEGYPLSEGSSNRKSCVLTCNWHNWKFDLKTGKCLVGGDNVRTYPVSISNEQIKIDLSDPTIEQVRNNIMEGLKVAFEKRQYGRISRELSRLIFNNIDPLYAIEKAILWSYDKFEYGMTHAYAVLADWIYLYEQSENLEEKVICLTEALDHIAYDVLRQPSFEYSNDLIEYSEKKLLESIESENSHTAESLIYSFFKEDNKFCDLEEVLSWAALSHYNDFGHSLIYVTKCVQLSNIFKSKEIDLALALNITRSLCYSTKEDLLPEFKDYAKTLNALKLKEQSVNKESIELPIVTIRQSYDWILENYSKDRTKKLYDVILRKNAQNFFRFDLKFQNATKNPVSQNVGWLDFTHAITFSNAVRKTCEKYPELWPSGLLQMISFYARNTSYIDESVEINQWKVASLETFSEHIKEVIFDHGLGLPIFSAHITKTYLATMEEVEHAPQETNDWLLASFNRFLNSPLKQKHVRRINSQGIKLVSKDFKR